SLVFFFACLQRTKMSGCFVRRILLKMKYFCSDQAKEFIGKKGGKTKGRHVTQHPSVQGTWTTAVRF
ncbi:hypothetical protein P3X46_034670, partial [Hevea brasiliensis]